MTDSAAPRGAESRSSFPALMLLLLDSSETLHVWQIPGEPGGYRAVMVLADKTEPTRQRSHVATGPTLMGVLAELKQQLPHGGRHSQYGQDSSLSGTVREPVYRRVDDSRRRAAPPLLSDD